MQSQRDQHVDDAGAGDVIVEGFAQALDGDAPRQVRNGDQPDQVATTSEVEARITVAQTLPASRETVENKAAPKARPRPTKASRNLAQISAEVDCSHCDSRPGTGAEGVDFNGLAYAEPTSSEPSILGERTIKIGLRGKRS